MESHVKKAPGREACGTTVRPPTQRQLNTPLMARLQKLLAQRKQPQAARVVESAAPMDTVQEELCETADDRVADGVKQPASLELDGGKAADAVLKATIPHVSTAICVSNDDHEMTDNGGTVETELSEAISTAAKSAGREMNPACVDKTSTREEGSAPTGRAEAEKATDTPGTAQNDMHSVSMPLVMSRPVDMALVPQAPLNVAPLYQDTLGMDAENGDKFNEKVCGRSRGRPANSKCILERGSCAKSLVERDLHCRLNAVPSVNAVGTATGGLSISASQLQTAAPEDANNHLAVDDKLPDTADFDLPFDDPADGLASVSSLTKIKPRRREQISYVSTEISNAALALSPEAGLEGRPNLPVSQGRDKDGKNACRRRRGRPPKKTWIPQESSCAKTSAEVDLHCGQNAPPDIADMGTAIDEARDCAFQPKRAGPGDGSIPVAACNQLTDLGDFALPFDDPVEGLAPGSSPTKIKACRRRRVSCDMEVMSLATTLSPDANLEGMPDLPVPTPDRRRSRRLRRKSIELYKVALEHRKRMQEAQSVLSTAPGAAAMSSPAGTVAHTESGLPSNVAGETETASPAEVTDSSIVPLAENDPPAKVSVVFGATHTNSKSSASTLVTSTSGTLGMTVTPPKLSLELPAKASPATQRCLWDPSTIKLTYPKDENGNVGNPLVVCDTPTTLERKTERSSAASVQLMEGATIQANDCVPPSVSSVATSLALNTLTAAGTPAGAEKVTSPSNLNTRPSRVANATDSSAGLGPDATGSCLENSPVATVTSGSPRRRRTASAAALVAISNAASPQTSSPGKACTKRKAETSLEDIYLNKLWKSQMPKERAWETIYESPQLSKKKTGETQSYISAKRFKRTVDFDSQHSQARMRRRRQRALKHGWKPISKKKQEQLSKELDQRLQSLAQELDTSLEGSEKESSGSAFCMQADLSPNALERTASIASVSGLVEEPLSRPLEALQSPVTAHEYSKLKSGISS